MNTVREAIYLDHAAATPLDATVLAAMQPYFAEQFYNPSALYLAAKDVAKDIAGARARVAQHLGVRPGEVFFTAGGTEANNLAIHGVMQHHPDANIVVSAIEHESVLKPAHQYNCREVSVNPQGYVEPDQLEANIDDNTVLVSIMYANNEIGSIQHISTLAQRLQTIRQKRAVTGNKTPLYFHTDACQAANYLHLQAHRLGVDLMTLNGGKMYGPKQSGTLFVASHVSLKSQVLGGGQERGLRSGTENVAGIIGFAAALDAAQQQRETEVPRLQTLQKHFMNLLEEKIPDVRINGGKQRLPNNIHITLPGHDNERLVMALDEAGVLCAAGSACSASTEEPSHVLKAIGLSDVDAQASLRFTMGRDTNEQAIRQTVETLAQTL